MRRKYFTGVGLTLGLVFAVAALSGCPLLQPPDHHHDHDHDVRGLWQHVDMEDEVVEGSLIEFTSDKVYFYGAVGGPNDMWSPEAKAYDVRNGEHDDHPHGPVFWGSYEIDEEAMPHTVDFTWSHYSEDGEHEMEEFEEFTQVGIWEIIDHHHHKDHHHDHHEDILYINFGDADTYPDDWEGEMKFYLVEHYDDHDHHHD